MIIEAAIFMLMTCKLSVKVSKIRSLVNWANPVESGQVFQACSPVDRFRSGSDLNDSNPRRSTCDEEMWEGVSVLQRSIRSRFPQSRHEEAVRRPGRK